MKFLGARLAFGLSLFASSAFAADKVSFGTNWLAEAEHGGYYQAVADGTYAKYGLDVTIVQGGPQANNELLLAAGRLDFYMGGNLLLAFDAVDRNVPIVVVAADFQKDPQVMMSHPGVGLDTWADLPQGDNSFRGQGGACHFLPVDDVGLRFQRGKRQALHVQPWAIHRRHPFDSARLRDLRAARRRARRSLQAQHLPARRQRMGNLRHDDRDARRSGQGSSRRRPAVRRRICGRLVQLSLRRQFESERADQKGQSGHDG